MAWRRPLLAAVLTSIGYFLGARLGFALTFHEHAVSTLWPPNSILLGALLLTPYRWWTIILVAVLPAHILVELNSGVPIAMVLCWFISNISEALIGAIIIRKLSDEPTRFNSIRRVSVFFTAAVTAPFVTTFLDSGFVILNGLVNDGYWQIWRHRFLSNVLAELTIVPIIVIWFRKRTTNPPRMTVARSLEMTALTISLWTVSLATFWSSTSSSPAALYAPLPILLWAAIRFGPKGVNTSLAVVAFLSTWSAVQGRGPFVGQTPEENALAIQLFLVVVSVPLMFLAAVLMELRRAQQLASQNEEQLRIAMSAAQIGLWDWHIAGDSTTWSDETKRMLGYQVTDPALSLEPFFAQIHPDDRQTVRQAVAMSIEKRINYEAEFRFAQPNGTFHWIHGKGKVLTDGSGRPLRMIGINADITKSKEAQAALMQSNLQVRALAGKLIRAQESERRRISHLLHDDLSQKLASFSVMISRLRRKPPTEAEMIVQLTNLYEQTEELSNDLRQLSHDMHPATLEHLGLAEALRSYISEFQNEEGIPANFKCELSSADISAEISVCLYRVTVEALRNIARHSHARSVGVALTDDEECVTLRVVDSGDGFDMKIAKRSNGLGLLSAEERVKLLQGTFDVSSTPGQGTRLTITLPLN